MKKWIILLSLLSSTTFAKGVLDAKALYKALTAMPAPVPAITLLTVYKKSVAGIDCYETQHVMTTGKPHTYRCEFNSNKLNAAGLYGALNMKPTKMAGAIGVINYQKGVPGLVCLEKKNVYPNAVPGYSCEIKIKF